MPFNTFSFLSPLYTPLIISYVYLLEVMFEMRGVSTTPPSLSVHRIRQQRAQVYWGTRDHTLPSGFYPKQYTIMIIMANIDLNLNVLCLLSYWQVKIKVKVADGRGGSLFQPATSFNLLEYMIIWCKIHSANYGYLFVN